MGETETKPTILGPFVGAVTADSVKIWFQLGEAARDGSDPVYVTLHKDSSGSMSIATTEVEKSSEKIDIRIAVFSSLAPDSLYYYQLWWDEACSNPIDLEGLGHEDLYFRTLPEQGYEHQLDFILMSCHNPAKVAGDGFDGFGVWRAIPDIINQNKNVRFAILAGDQVYGDEVAKDVLEEDDPEKRASLYLGVYQKFWSNIYYRRVLCSLPAVLMWDDHDIVDGWGSRDDSFIDGESAVIKPEWTRLFMTARDMFGIMQANRNPARLATGKDAAFDTCFKVGKAGFIVADLRSNRNIREGRLWLPEQLSAIRAWVNANKKGLDTIFLVTPVVFSHGAPVIENLVLKYWLRLLDFLKWFRRFFFFSGIVRRFVDKVGDIRDDVNDSWGAVKNAAEADRALDFLFELQNPRDGDDPLNVVILSGDIHTPGYSTIYSSDAAHKDHAAIPHVVASPVAYKPLSWVGEAIFRHLTKTVHLGEKQIYTSQISHHFCYRNVVVVSLRNYIPGESHLKAKYYLERFPEPNVVLFDLNHGSRSEAIDWPEPKKG